MDEVKRPRDYAALCRRGLGTRRRGNGSDRTNAPPSRREPAARSSNLVRDAGPLRAVPVCQRPGDPQRIPCADRATIYGFGLPSATCERKRERRESSRSLHWRIQLAASRGRTSALIYSSAAGRSWSPGAPSWRSRRGSRPALGWPFSRSTHFPAIGGCGPRPARRPSRSARRLGGPSATSEAG